MINMHEQFLRKLDELSRLALEMNGTKYPYSDMDLCNALLILMEVFMSKIVDHHGGKLPQEGMEKLAEEAGKSLRQSMILFTGVDPHKVLQSDVNNI